jgi:hypothetical protein
VHPYSQKYSLSIEEAVYKALVNTKTETQDIKAVGHVTGIQTERIALLSGGKFQS